MADRETCPCGATIEWKVLPSGVRCPMQRVKTIYAGGMDERVGKIETGRPMPPMYVSHFETCPKANEFSRRRKR